MKELEQSRCGYSSHNSRVHEVSASTMNDDAFIIENHTEITSRGKTMLKSGSAAMESQPCMK
ncbi:MAG: hypothetical protein ACLSCD_04975 [Subdoligranulum sp.]